MSHLPSSVVLLHYLLLLLDLSIGVQVVAGVDAVELLEETVRDLFHVVVLAQIEGHQALELFLLFLPL